MKRESTVFAMMGVLLFVTASCASSGSSSKATKVENKVTLSNEHLTLEDYLRRLSGVQVIGNRVTIRGNMSISNPNEQPLFVLNGQEIGRSLSAANRLVVRGTIKSVEAIPPSRAAEYGMQGGAGVIVIVTE